MLVLARQPGQELLIGEGVKITVVRLEGSRVTLGIEAPRDMRILRGELADVPEEPLIVEVVADDLPTPIHT